MQKIITFLWFNTQAEEAAQFYTSIFKDSKIVSTMRSPEGTPNAAANSVLTVTFQLEGQQFTAINGGPQYKFSPAISLYVNCSTQQEVDELWSKLTAGGGKESQCGWLEDKYGLSWQIIPSQMIDLMQDKDPEKARKAMQAMLQMHKIDLAEIQKAHDSGGLS